MEFPPDLYPQQADVTREEILRQIFGDVGELHYDFSCAVETSMLLHGRMYVTNKFLCFYSNLFGVEKKIRIPYSHITLITKENTALVIPNAIAITTSRKEYLFRSFWDRDECFRILQELTDKYKTGKTTNAESAVAAANSSGIADIPPQPSQTFSPVIMNKAALAATESPSRPSSLSSGELGPDLRSILARRTMTAASPLTPGSMPPTAHLLQQRQQAYAQRLGQQQQSRSRAASNASNQSVYSSSTSETLGHSQYQQLPPTPQAAPTFSQQRSRSAILRRGASQPIQAAPSRRLSRQYSDVSPLYDDQYASGPEYDGSAMMRSASERTPPFHLVDLRTRAISVDEANHFRQGQEQGQGQGQGESPVQYQHRHTVAVDGSEQEEDTMDVRSPLLLPSPSQTDIDLRAVEGAQIEAAFRDEHRRSLLKQRVVTNEVLPVSAAQFKHMFYDDDAQYGMKRYHEGTKDRNVQVSPWAASMTGRDPSGVQSAMREMRFMKPITHALAGVKESRAIKVFRLKNFGDVGFVIMTSTRMEDIPAGNTFSVDEALIARNIGANRVAVDMSFEVKFIARTILKLAIESNTNADMKKWVKAFFDRTKAHCVHYANEHPYVPAQPTSLPPSPLMISSPTMVPSETWERSTAEALVAGGVSTSGDELAAAVTAVSPGWKGAPRRRTGAERGERREQGENSSCSSEAPPAAGGVRERHPGGLPEPRVERRVSTSFDALDVHEKDAAKAPPSNVWLSVYVGVFSVLVLFFMLYALEKISLLASKLGEIHSVLDKLDKK